MPSRPGSHRRLQPGLLLSLFIAWGSSACARQLMDRGILAQLEGSGLFWNGLHAHAPEQPNKSDAHPQMTEFVQCVNKGYKPQEMTWERAIARQLPSIKVVGAWWTRRTSPVPLTVITHSDMGRLNQLEAQCHSWAGPLDATLYIPLVQDSLDTLTEDHRKIVHRAMVQIASLFQRMESNTSTCALSVTLVYEICKTEDVAILYPVNTMRNLAVAQARTPLVAMLDVDMLVSKDLYTSLLSDTARDALMKAVQLNHAAMVLPAFQTIARNEQARKPDEPVEIFVKWGRHLAEGAVRHDKAALIKAVNEGNIMPFDTPYNPEAHSGTDFNRWYNTTEAYEVQHKGFFEPWVILERATFPPYDERLRGYGYNKNQHLSYLRQLGRPFMVYPFAFIVHRDHPFSTARHLHSREVAKQEGKTQYAAAIKELWTKEMLPAMQKGTYTPVSSELTQTLPACLSWGPKRSV